MNQEINNHKDNEKKKKKSEFEFCKACNLNHDHGRRHKYFPNHKKSLSAFLSRFQSKLADVRFFLKNPSVLRPEHASRNRLWCVFCDADFDEIGSSFACANAINHLASEEHLKNLKHFLWKYGGGMDRADAFRVLEADLAKWEKKCELLKNEGILASDGSRAPQVGPVNDIRNERNHENINNFDNNAFDPVKSNLSNGVMPLQCYTHEYQISHSGLSAVANVGSSVHGANSSLVASMYSGSSAGSLNGSTVNWNSQHSLPCNSSISSHNVGTGGLQQVYQGERMVMGVTSSHGFQNLTQISTIAPGKGEGNVHTGAPPPWFEATEENLLNVSVSLLKKPGKSNKLNPKRVGAAWAEKRKIELEMEKRGDVVKNACDANWLPNFGRVWQSGSRKESRKEFEKEKQRLPKAESHSEIPITIQPYVSKRMRKDAGE